jgi:hypothetical protein
MKIINLLLSLFLLIFVAACGEGKRRKQKPLNPSSKKWKNRRQ